MNDEKIFRAKLSDVMWIRIWLDPYSFGSMDPDPEVYNEGESGVLPTKIFVTLHNIIFFRLEKVQTKFF